MEIITNIFTATVKARVDGCDNRGVIAQTDSGKTYCLYYQSTAHGFQRLAKSFTADVARNIADLSEVFEVVVKTSRKGNTYYQAAENQY